MDDGNNDNDVLLAVVLVISIMALVEGQSKKYDTAY